MKIWQKKGIQRIICGYDGIAVIWDFENDYYKAIYYYKDQFYKMLERLYKKNIQLNNRLDKNKLYQEYSQCLREEVNNTLRAEKKISALEDDINKILKSKDKNIKYIKQLCNEIEQMKNCYNCQYVKYGFMDSNICGNPDIRISREPFEKCRIKNYKGWKLKEIDK